MLIHPVEREKFDILYYLTIRTQTKSVQNFTNVKNVTKSSQHFSKFRKFFDF